MITLDVTGRLPIYEQLCRGICGEIAKGGLQENDRLPAARALAKELGINPNTVQKAFKMLEDEALIESQAGAKSTMTLDGEKIAKLREEVLREDIRSIATALRQMGISREEAIRLLSENWEETES